MKMKKAVKISAWSVFVLYCAVLLYILILDKAVSGYHQSLRNILAHINLIPFRTIATYIVRLANDSINLDTVIKNLAGNLLLFVPMGAFLPFAFDKMKKLWRVVLVLLVVILSVELMQIVLAIGSFDVDDLLLNMLGGMLGYSIFLLPPVRKLGAWCIEERAKSK